LYIDSTDYDWKEYPVIHIDFGKCQKTTAIELRSWLNRNLIKIGESYNVKLDTALEYDDNLDILIEELSKKGNVVILIDEYDKVLSSNIYNPKVEEIRDVLKGFFEIIKACYKNLRFVFITGVTKYAKLSVFSSMNNLNEIGFDEPYSNMFGFTQDEIETYFSEYIEEGYKALGCSREKYLEELKNKYDGYRFSPLAKETVYNPVSICSFFAKGGVLFNNYWSETGSMKLLMDIAKKVNFNVVSSLEKPIVASNISSFDILEMTTGDVTLLKYESLLLQSGYLTIRRSSPNGKELYLGFPNEEVEESYASNLLEVYGGKGTEDSFNSEDLKEQFEEGNTQGIIDNLYSVYAAIPYREGQKQVEADYQGMFYAMMIVMHAEVYLEILTNKGRIDAVVKTPKHVYVIEFKKDESAKKALEQKKDKGYYERYKAWSNDAARKVHLLGINFSTEKRNISDWKEEILK